MINFTDRQFNRIAMFGLAIGFFLLLAALLSALIVFRGNRVVVDSVRHTYEVIDEISRVEVQLERAETGRRGYLLAPERYKAQIIETNSRLVPQSLSRLEQLVSDNPTQLVRVRQARELIEARLKEIGESLALARSGQIDEARAMFAAADQTRLIRAARDLTAQIRASELDLLDSRMASESRNLPVLQWVLVITGLLLFLVGAGAFAIVRRYTVNLTATRDRLHVLNTDLEGEVDRRTADLRRAHDEIQRFAYIVSHDLRSPLVNILGFTAELESTNKTLGELIQRAKRDAPELLTEDMRQVQQDLPEAIGFIRSSTQKMDRLINAILRLSREGRRTLTPEKLPMEVVLDEVAASLAQRVEESGAALVIEKPLPDITSDRVAIEQIFSNIIENALKYGDPGRPTEVRVRGAVKESRLIFEIQDNGRGIDPKDHQRIFDLFRRSGAQDKAGEGIGLAQVRALVNRLGGHIDVESELGEGSVFRLSLPITYVDRGVNQ